MQRILFISVVLGLSALLSACSNDGLNNLKSPCAGIEGSPCGPKRSVNDWWLKESHPQDLV